MQAAAVRRVAVRRDKHNLAAFVGNAKREHLGHERADLTRREFTTAITFFPTSVSGLYCSVIWADDLRVPISGPKSITSLIAGLRASGKGAASTTVPHRMSIFMKSSKLTGGVAASSLLISSLRS